MRSFTETDAALRYAESGLVSDRGSLDRALLENQFERILAEHGAALSRLAGSYTNTTGDRDDLLQEIAFAIWQSLTKFRNECSERTFAFRIAHNRGITYLARSRSRAADSLDDVEMHDPLPGPESKISEKQRSATLKDAVRKLPLAYRQVILLTLEGLGYKEISEVLGISESNVGARLTRARQMLQEQLENKR